jgi:hypothetical protein
MPRHEITSPDGVRYWTEGPEGSTREDAIRMAPQLLAEGKLHRVEAHQPGLGEMLTDTHGGKSFFQFAWDKLLGHVQELPGKLKEAGAAAYAGEGYDPSAPMEVAGALAGGRFPLAGGGERLAAVPRAVRGAAERVLPADAAIAGEAGLRGGMPAAEYKAGLRGEPLMGERVAAKMAEGATEQAPTVVPEGQRIGVSRQLETRRALDEQRQAAISEATPYGEAGRRLGASGPSPGRTLAGALAFGRAGAAAGYLGTPRGAGAAMYGLGAAERMLPGSLPRPLTRAAIIAGAAELLRDREAKKELPSKDLKILRATQQEDATSSALLAAQSVLLRAGQQPRITTLKAKPGQVDYAGLDAGRVTGGAQATNAPQPPSPGEPSTAQPAAGAASHGVAPELTGQGALPLPGQSPGLSRLSTTGQAPVAATNVAGQTIPEFLWSKLLGGAKDLSAELKEAGRSAFMEPEKFSPAAPLKAAGYAMTGGMPMAEAGALGAAGGRLKQAFNVHDVPGMRGIAEHLTPEELGELTKHNVAGLMEAFKGMPSADEMAAVAYSGRAKRGWYKQSAQALIDTFGNDDAPRFAGLLAALSPQTSVQSNTENALRTWLNWTKAGRPGDEASIRKILGQSVQGKKGEESILEAWIGNSVRALRAEDPTAVQLSGAKVNSFMLNLRNHVHEVTNDAWMARYAGVPQTEFAARRIKERYGEGEAPIGEGKIGVKSMGYMAMSAAARRAAKRISELTGETWTPAEIQETIWSWAKTVREKVYGGPARKGVGGTVADLLKAGNLTHEEIADTPDFALLFTRGIYRTILESAGYGDTIKRIEAELGRTGAGGRKSAGGPAPTRAEGGPFAETAYRRHLKRAGQRLETIEE